MTPGERVLVDALETEVLHLARLYLGQMERIRDESMMVGESLVKATQILARLKSGEVQDGS